VGHDKPINSRRFLHDCHEFVFHVTPEGSAPFDHQAIGLSRTRLSSSTAVACAQLGLSVVGIEMDARYLKEAVTRTRAAAVRS
jgi:hypothetical protein